MKKDFFIYIALLVLSFIAVLIIWPTRWINVDIGSFHYHKLWEGPSLSDLSFGVFDHEFDFPLGKDFTGGTTYTLNVTFPQEVEQSKAAVSEIVTILRDRLDAMGYKEALVYYEQDGESYVIYAETSAPLKEFINYESVLFSQGDFVITAQESTGAEIQVAGESEDIASSFQVDGNGIKGFRVMQEDQGLYLEIGLSDEQTEQLTNSVMLLFGKTLQGNLDGIPLYIDSNHLSEQIQFNGKIRTLRLMIFGDEEQAKAYGATIKHGPISAQLDVANREAFDGKFGSDFPQRGMYVGVIFLLLVSILFTVLYRLDGLVAAVAILLYAFVLVAVSKAFHVMLTFGTIATMLYGIGTFVGIIGYALFEVFKDKKREAMEFVRLFEGKRFNTFLLVFLVPQLIIGLVMLVIAPWSLKFMATQLVISLVLQWLWFDLILTFTYSVFNIVRN